MPPSWLQTPLITAMRSPATTLHQPGRNKLINLALRLSLLLAVALLSLGLTL